MNTTNDNIKKQNYHHLSTKESTKLIILRNEGLSLERIGKILNRNPSTIKREYDRITIPAPKKTNRTFTQICEKERKRIEILYKGDFSYGQIAQITSRSKSSIWYEINRNGRDKLPSAKETKKSYTHKQAHEKAIQRRKNNLAKSYDVFITYFEKLDGFQKSLYHIITDFKKLHPFQNIPCFQTLYNWLRLKKIEYNCTFRKIRKYRTTIKNIRGPENRKSICDRGFELDDYTQAGHYEIDLVLSPQNKGGVLTLNHRHTCKYYTRHVDSKSATDANKALRDILENELKGETIYTITSDNGPEFFYSKVIEETYNLKWFYADPYCSGQRGQNERLNRDLRKFFPKGTDFKRVTSK